MDDFIKNILEDNSIEQRTDSSGNTYRIKVLGRGESLFFQENNKCLFCEIDASNGVVFSKSIKRWEPKEKRRVIALVEKYYRKIYHPDVKIL